MNRTTTQLSVSPSGKAKQTSKSSNMEYPFEPSVSVIKTILNYSKALQVKSSALIEHVELILN